MKRKKNIFRKCPKCSSHCSFKDYVIYCKRCGYIKDFKNKKELYLGDYI